MLLIYFGQQLNKITNFFNIFFWYAAKLKEKKKLVTKEFLQKQQEMKILEGYNLINEANL